MWSERSGYGRRMRSIETAVVVGQNCPSILLYTFSSLSHRLHWIFPVSPPPPPPPNICTRRSIYMQLSSCCQRLMTDIERANRLVIDRWLTIRSERLKQQKTLLTQQRNAVHAARSGMVLWNCSARADCFRRKDQITFFLP